MSAFSSGLKKFSTGTLGLLTLTVLSPWACKKAPEPQPSPAPSATGTPVAEAIEVDIKNTWKPAEGAAFIKVPLGLDPFLNFPQDNPPTPEKVALGKLLYFDERLSVDNTVSCATCHNPNLGWSDGHPVSTGVQAKTGTRNAPTVINATYMLSQFWDGRAQNLEEQALGPIINPVEMAMPNHEVVVDKIKNIPAYQPLFQQAFGEGPSKENIAKAIASFERTVLGGNSRYDRFESGGDANALTAQEKLGRELFFGKANCTRCHVGSNFSDSQFHNLGVGMNRPKPDLGRYEVTRVEADKGAFKTPTVRDVSKHAPYMHDGSQATLEEVVEFYDKGGEANPWLDSRIVKLNLSAEEKAALVAFMKALDSDPYPYVEKPELPK